MGKMSKTKGKVGEREVAALLRQYGFNARRGQQFSGAVGDQDIVSDMEGFHIEVKRVESLSIYAAMAQASRDARNGDAPLVFHRRSKKPWLVIMDAKEFLEIMRDYVYEKVPNETEE